MAKYFCISSPAVCYDDLVQYYVMKQLLEDVAVAKADDAYYSQMANDFTKTVGTQSGSDSWGYNRYIPSWKREYAVGTITGYTNDQLKTQLDTDFNSIKYGTAIGSSASHVTTAMANDGLLDTEGDPADPGTKGTVFQVNNTNGPSIHQEPYSNATTSTAAYDKLYTATDVKFIYIDFYDKFSTHFDTWWNKLNLSQSGNSTWQTNKADYKADVRNNMGTQSFSSDEGPGTATKTWHTWTMGYPTHPSGTADDRVYVLPIDKLLDKDATTMSELATFLGVNVSTNANNIIDEYKSFTTV